MRRRRRFGFAVLPRTFLLVQTALWFQSLGRRFGASLPAFLHSLDYFSKAVSWKLSAGEEGEPRQDSQSTTSANVCRVVGERNPLFRIFAP